MVQPYRFAEDEAGQFVDVRLLTRDTRHILGPYKCLSCGDRVIPALGERVAHHFRHKTERACHGETYLHHAGRRVFLDAFTAAVAAGSPYPVQRLRAEVCRRFESQFGKTCQFDPHLETFDLTRWVSRATAETEVDGFRADILLANGDGSVKLLVEIAVKHRCEEAKIASGLKIMEVPIASEDDIDRLREGLTLEGSQCWNFNLAERPPPAERLICRGCQTSVDLFVI